MSLFFVALLTSQLDITDTNEFAFYRLFVWICRIVLCVESNRSHSRFYLRRIFVRDLHALRYRRHFHVSTYTAFIYALYCSLTVDARRTLVTAFMANRVDYCNEMWYGTSTAVTRRLQVVLNAAARMVVGIGKYEHITPVLDTLHWLPVTARIQFKIAALTFDCVRCTGPVYLKQVICPVSDLSRRSLRSAGRGDMFVSRANTFIGQRSFSISAPVV